MTDIERSEVGDVLTAFADGWRIVEATVDGRGDHVWILRRRPYPETLCLAIPKAWIILSAPFVDERA